MVCVPNSEYKALPVQTATCTESPDGYYCPVKNMNLTAFCITTDNTVEYKYADSTNGITCDNGFWIIIDEYGNYFGPAKSCSSSQCTPPDTQPVKMEYALEDQTPCQYNYRYTNNKWVWSSSCSQATAISRKLYNYKIVY